MTTVPEHEELLPCPGVRFAPDFVRRLERFVPRLAATRERREGTGRAALVGAGEEFVGYRPYRPGEDLRQLDWSLFARLDQPYVRVTRREASERWAILVDASASMGVGPPGKLQAAAEVACALACVALRSGARVHLRASSAGAVAPALEARRSRDLPAVTAFLEGLRATGSAGLATLLRHHRPLAQHGRVFLVGDLLDVDPRDVLALRARGRDLRCLQLLAPIELSPPAGRAVEWLDPEGAGRVARTLDPATLRAYARALEERLEAWDRLAARHGFAYCLAPSDRDFEDVVRDSLGVG